MSTSGATNGGDIQVSYRSSTETVPSPIAAPINN